EQAMAQQGSPETDAARDMAETSLTQIEQLLNDTDELQFGFNIDQAAKQMSFKARFTAVPGTSLGEILSSQEAIPSQFASVIRPDAAAFYHSASAIGPESVQQVQSSMKAASASIAGVLESQANLPQEYQQKVMGLVDRILDLASASAAEGKSDLGAVLLAGENSMQFALGTFVSNGNDVAAIAKDLAAEIEGVPGAPAFMFDQEVYEGVTMHLVEIDIPPFEEEMIEVLGEKLQIHIGTGEKAVYLATGKGSKALLTSMIDSAGQDKSSSRPVGQLHFSLMPMLELAQSVNADDSVMAMIDSLSRAADTGKIMMISESIENGQDFTLSIGEGLLQAAGAAARQEQLEAQRNAIQNGQF
ncbi:hypothetical protein OAA19_01300, partial [Rubripirellula sp.]|nr:hypothetical protein [Rubripirellula sp.]